MHPSHITIFSFDASTWDEMCINCHNTDKVPGGWGKLADPCPKPVGQGGITWEEYCEIEIIERLKGNILEDKANNDVADC